MTRRRSTIPADYFEDHEREVILNYLDKGKENHEVSTLCGVPIQYVIALRAEYFPTTGLASRIFKAKAAQMAETVIREGSARDLIDVLSRPNMGVLDPPAKAGLKTGILISTNTSDLGGVQVAVAIQQGEFGEGEANQHGHDEQQHARGDGLDGRDAPVTNVHPFPTRTLPLGPSPADEPGRDALRDARVENPEPVAPVQRERQGHSRRKTQRRPPHGKSRPAVPPPGRGQASTDARHGHARSVGQHARQRPGRSVTPARPPSRPKAKPKRN